MIHSFYYQKGKPLETDLTRAQMLAALRNPDSLLWVDFDEATEFESEALVEIFNFHDLAVEDCIADLSQPKVDDYEEYLFLVVHAVQIKEHKLHIIEQDIFLGPNFVVTYHKEPISCMQAVREAARRKPDSNLGKGSDMLVYTILDLVVDRYQPVLDYYEDQVDRMEEEIFHHATRDYLSDVIQVKRDVFHFRRTIAPQRDALNLLARNDFPLIHPDNQVYFRNVYDHLFRIYGFVEGFHEATTGIMQAYFSFSSNRLNEVMKRMTVMATLSMPAIMIASIYGMNFQNMPELNHPYGYYGAIALMFVTSVGMLIWMKIKKWI